jgi:tetratricopeptide (TPR) repeat protein
MPLVPLLLCAPFLGAPLPTGPTAGQRTAAELGELPTIAPSLQEHRGRVAWFVGSYEALLQEAARTKRIVFLDFYSRSNAFSKRLEKSTYLDERVLAELRDVLCYSIDADAKETKPLRKRFQVLSPPALVFLDPDGALRDQISGYFAPEPFLRELVRIKANKGTFSVLRARILRDPDDLDARWELACKQREIGDLLGFEEQVAEIRDRDRDGRTAAARRMHLEDLYQSAAASLDLEPLYAFVAAEKEPALRFEAWWKLWMLEGQAARSARDSAGAQMHLTRHFAAARALWPLVPVEEHKTLGNNIAWSIYENRACATRADLEFALEVAQVAVAAARDVPYVVDTLACCLFALGRRDEALVEIRRCIELDPQNPEWRERLALFEKTLEKAR